MTSHQKVDALYKRWLQLDIFATDRMVAHFFGRLIGATETLSRKMRGRPVSLADVLQSLETSIAHAECCQEYRRKQAEERAPK